MKRILSVLFILMLLALPATAENYQVKVSSPNGAPGIALAALAVSDPEQYTYVAAEAITAEFAGAKADFDESLAVFLSDLHINGFEVIAEYCANAHAAIINDVIVSREYLRQ